MKRRDVLRTGAAAAALGVFGGPAFGQAKTVLKASDVHPLGYPTVEAVERLGKKLDAQTNGRYSVQMFPSMQLGGEKEALEQAQVGALAFARVSVGVVGPLVDDLNVFNMPFVFRDVKPENCNTCVSATSELFPATMSSRSDVTVTLFVSTPSANAVPRTLTSA